MTRIIPGASEMTARIFHHSSDMIAIISREHLIWVNQCFLDTLGYSKEQVVGQSVYDLGIISSEDNTMCRIYEALQTQGEIRNIEYHYHAKSGQTIYLLFSGFNITYNDEACWLFIIKDVSAQKSYEQELTRLDRLNLIGEMAATVGHEVRNPMTTVRGFLQMLQMKEPASSENCLYYNIMIEELDRANAIITEFLSVARGKVIDLRPQCITRIISALHPMIHSQAIMKDLNLVIDMGSPPQLMLDEHEIRQMVLNLAHNGLESMLPGGTLTIGTWQDESGVTLYIRDQGSGIAPEHLEKIGTPFFTTKERGTGLGLSVCRSIAARHGARIEIDTGPQGTTFKIHFPLINDHWEGVTSSSPLIP